MDFPQNSTVTWITNQTLLSDEISNLTIPNGTSKITRRLIQKWTPPPLTTLGYVIIPMYVVIFLVAVLGNALVILTLYQNKRMRTVTNVLLLNLSLSDLLLAVFCMPFTFIPIMLKNFIFGEVMCVMIRYLQGVSVAVSCFTLVAISLERYFAICRPLQSRAWQTLSHSYKTIVVCWILALLVMIPIPVFTKYKYYPAYEAATCRENWPNHSHEMAYAMVIDCLLLALPLLVMSVAYGVIAHTLWMGMKEDEKSEREAINGGSKICREESSFLRSDDTSTTTSNTNGYLHLHITPVRNTYRTSAKSYRINLAYSGIRQSNSEKSRASKRRVIKMLLALVMEFFVCWTPLYVVQTWIIFDFPSAKQHITAELLAVFNLMAYISSCCNPVTYCFMNKNFRQGFLSVFRCVRKRRLGRLKSDMSYYAGSTMSRTHVSRVSSYDKMQQDSDEM